MNNNPKKSKNIKIPYKFDSRYVFEDSLIRIYRLICDVKTLEEIMKKTKLPYVFSEDASPTIFDYTLKEYSTYESYKEISWLLTCNEIKTPIKIDFTLTENTIDYTVLVVFEISIVQRELIPEKYKYKIISSFEGIAVDVLNNIIIKLKNDNKDIYHYESKIFNYSRDKLMNIIFNLNEIMKEKGVISSITREGEKNKEGEVISITLTEEQKVLKIRINEIKINEKDFQWRVSYMPLDLSYQDYIVEWVIIKLEENKTLIIINNLYYEQIEPDIFKKLTDTKQNLFKVIEEELKKKYPD